MESFFTVFKTRLGWIALRWTDRGLNRVKFGYATKNDVISAVAGGDGASIDADGQEALIDRLKEFAQGIYRDFGDVELDLSQQTRFQRRVTQACRKIPYGTTLSYGQLADKVGSPSAARAVGNVMANNPFPLIVPCHRVIGGNQTLGGFSAPRGLEMKRRLLELECDGLGKSLRG